MSNPKDDTEKVMKKNYNIWPACCRVAKKDRWSLDRKENKQSTEQTDEMNEERKHEALKQEPRNIRIAA